MGGRGSGTFFLSGCALGCPFCQNWQISRSLIGEKLSIPRAGRICLDLQEAGAANINFVTGSHFARPLTEVIQWARREGLTLPVLWNSSAYETRETLEILAPHIDIWLPDLKTVSPFWASKIYGKREYAERAGEAVTFMADRAAPSYDEEGLMTKGMIVRHLIIPGALEATREVLAWYGDRLRGKALLSLLSQYTPVRIPGENRPIPERFLREDEYEQVLEWLDELAIEDGFIQEWETGSDWLPDFREEHPFSADLSRVIWKAGTDPR